jgi:hypothetical protein
MCLECGCGEHTALICPECGGRVILINEETKCLSCGASPSLEAASEGGKTHHHAEQTHTHDEAVGVESAEVHAKLRVLLPHWIEHNADHAKSFCAWADRARAAGDEHLAAHIEEAGRKIEAASRDLEGGLQHIGVATGEHEHVHDEPVG